MAFLPALPIPSGCSPDGFLTLPTVVADEIQIRRVQAGFGGYGRVGEALPVAVELTGASDPGSLEVEVTAADPSGNQCHFRLHPANVSVEPASDTADLRLYSGTILVGRLPAREQPGTVRITVTQGDRRVAQRNIAVTGAGVDDPVLAPEADTATLSLVRHDQELVVVIGKPVGLAELERNLSEENNDDRPLVVAELSEPSLYDDVSSAAFLAADSIVIADNSTLSAQCVQNLRRWTLCGGRLLVGNCGGAEELKNSPLGTWIGEPVGLTGATRRLKETDLTSIQILVRGATRLTSNRRDFFGAVVEPTDADVLADSPDGPLITRLAAGAGTLTFIALDLETGPLAQWNSSAGLYDFLLSDATRQSESEGPSAGQRISQSGISDLSSQFANELEVVTPSERWSTWSVMGLLVGLLVLIGPVDYFLVTKILKRPRLTWLTLPLFVGGGVLAVSTLQPQAKVGDIVTSQVDVIDVATGPLGSGIHTRTWVSMASQRPRRATMTWTAEPGLAGLMGKRFDDVAQLNWFGRAEDIFGGMYRAGGLSLGQLEYEMDGRNAKGLPLLAGSSDTLEGDAWVSTDQRLITSELRTIGRRFLTGKLTHHLPWTLHNYIIIQDQRAYIADDEAPPESRFLKPDVPLDLERNVRSVDLRTFLTQSRIAEIAGGTATSVHHVAVARPYAQIDHSPFSILVMASLHEAAGGSQYTNLENRQFRDMELTENLRLKQAILIAQVETPMTEFASEDAQISRDRFTSIVRVMIPVFLQTAPDSPED